MLGSNFSFCVHYSVIFMVLNLGLTLHIQSYRQELKNVH